MLQSKHGISSGLNSSKYSTRFVSSFLVHVKSVSSGTLFEPSLMRRHPKFQPRCYERKEKQQMTLLQVALPFCSIASLKTHQPGHSLSKQLARLRLTTMWGKVRKAQSLNVPKKGCTKKLSQTSLSKGRTDNSKWIPLLKRSPKSAAESHRRMPGNRETLLLLYVYGPNEREKALRVRIRDGAGERRGKEG